MYRKWRIEAVRYAQVRRIVQFTGYFVAMLQN